MEELSPPKVKKPRKKKLPGPKKIRFTKKQRDLMRYLNSGGFVSMKKQMNTDNARFQVLDVSLNPQEFVNKKTMDSLLERKIIYKATDGRYYSVKYYEGDESKPVQFTNNSQQQAACFGSEEATGNHRIKRASKSGTKIKGD